MLYEDYHHIDVDRMIVDFVEDLYLMLESIYKNKINRMLVNSNVYPTILTRKYPNDSEQYINNIR